MNILSFKASYAIQMQTCADTLDSKSIGDLCQFEELTTEQEV